MFSIYLFCLQKQSANFKIRLFNIILKRNNLILDFIKVLRVAYLWRIHIGVGNGSEFSLSRHRVTSFNLFGQAQNNKKERVLRTAGYALFYTAIFTFEIRSSTPLIYSNKNCLPPTFLQSWNCSKLVIMLRYISFQLLPLPS